MKILPVALATVLSALPVFAAPADAVSSDRAAHVLARHGSVPVKAAVPYVEIGTFRIQVSVKLGRPAQTLPDGTWLYPNFTVAESQATGTLVVRFKRNCVSELVLVTPAVALAMTEAQAKPEKARFAGSR